MVEPVTARTAEGVGSIDRDEWDACAGSGNPFVSHDFLTALEESGSAVARTGWQPVPIVIDGADGRPAAILPAYAKSHSQGEYVFDHAWADAWERAGGDYYPKLQIAVPFTPGARPAPAAARSGARARADRGGRGGGRPARPVLRPCHLRHARADAAVRGGGLADPHRPPVPLANQGYASFEDFLGALASRKRKAIRKERAAARGAGDPST
jgi:predicted N-acyltransferase